MSSNIKKGEEPLKEFEDESFSLDQMVTYFLIAFAFIIAVLTFFVFNDGIAVQKEQKISTYISNSDKLLKDTEELTEPLYLYANGEKNSVTSEEEVLVDLRKIMSDGQALAAPEEFLSHKETVNAIIVKRYSVAYTFFLGNRSKKLAEEKFAEIDKLKEEENTILISALEKANLNYEVLEDGTIRFFYKSY